MSLMTSLFEFLNFHAEVPMGLAKLWLGSLLNPPAGTFVAVLSVLCIVVGIVGWIRVKVLEKREREEYDKQLEQYNKQYNK